MRSTIALFFLASFIPACSDPAPAESGTETGTETGTDTGTDPGTESGTSGGPEQPDDPVALVCDLMRAACERQVACGHPVLNNNPGDIDACLAEQRCGSVGDLLALPDIEFDPGAVEACGAAIEAASCGELAAQGLAIDPACTQYVVGTLGEGDSCRGGTISDCAAGLDCVFDDQTCPGTCTAPPERCSEGSCGADGFCASDGACRPRAAIGEACDETLVDFDNLRDDPCVTGAHCEASVCVADLDAGAACQGKNLHACGDGAACICADPAACESEADFACRPARAEGEPCNMALDCGEDLYCNYGDGGRCAQRGGLGAACDDSFGACLHPLVCVDGQCADEQPAVTELPLLAEGESCADPGSCPLGTACTCDNDACTEKRCLPAPGLGESCEAQMLADITPFACSEGACDLLAGYTCVLPAAAGEPCPVDGITLACASLLCTDGTCDSVEQTRCQE